ncbi:TetR/AcrR family transcriptional regulator [Herbiconiux sp. P17]|uniref:TetR/AcrR family transcriptional regulator n=1 Tax=Herbiconiux wuyangfengii TaxID=3342794 RepID=UPI0035B9E7B0
MTKTRADAVRNRSSILDAAVELFATQGLEASVQAIADRAGVSTGTVSRHFPTKDLLYEAVLSRGMDELSELARSYRSERDPGPAFFALFDAVVTAGSANRGLAQRLNAAINPKAIASIGRSVQILCDELEATLSAAQRAGAVRPELTLEDVETLMDACMSRTDAPQRLAAVVKQGLRPL